MAGLVEGQGGGLHVGHEEGGELGLHLQSESSPSLSQMPRAITGNIFVHLYIFLIFTLISNKKLVTPFLWGKSYCWYSDFIKAFEKLYIFYNRSTKNKIAITWTKNKKEENFNRWAVAFSVEASACLDSRWKCFSV